MDLFWKNAKKSRESEKRYKKVNRCVDKEHLIKLSICNYGIKNVTGFFSITRRKKLYAAFSLMVVLMHFFSLCLVKKKVTSQSRQEESERIK